MQFQSGRCIEYFFTDMKLARTGNPAGVCLLGDKTLSNFQYLTISKEMRHSETAFLTRDTASERNNVFFLRWFTPTTEVSLCGYVSLHSI
jgi:PhzF family phenazine biosynthesis protein